MKAGIMIDAWKRDIFVRHFTQAGYSFREAGSLIPGTLTFIIVTDNKEALAGVISAANAEASRTRGAK